MVRRLGWGLVGWIVLVNCSLVLISLAVLVIHCAYRAYNHASLLVELGALRGWAEQFRDADLDGNGIKDYWTNDVAGVYYVPEFGGQDLEMACADGRTCRAYPGHRSAARFGYWLFALQQGADLDGRPAWFRDHASTQFAVAALPSFYRLPGDYVFILREGGRVSSWDPGGNEFWKVRPLTDVEKTEGMISLPSQRIEVVTGKYD